ncbi:MAG: choice-of-anchor D domain-containing protein [Usitatibacter sp.]
MRTQRRRSSISHFRQTPLVAALGLALMPCAANAANVVTVTDSSDALLFDTESHDITLRGAIDYFNNNCTGADTINFDLPSGPFVVSLASDLPRIQCNNLTIDGKNLGTVPATAGINIGITTTSASTNFGLQTDFSSTVTAKNLEISGFTYGSAIGLSGRFQVSGSSLHDNGTGFCNNGYSGVSITNSTVSSNSTGIYVSYGGSPVPPSTATVTGNTITNNGVGVLIHRDQGSEISFNYIGSGNGTGLQISPDSPGAMSFRTNVHDNTISANSGRGISLTYFQDVTIHHNWIGTNSSDGAGLGNGQNGVNASCGSGLELSDNVVSANGGTGFYHGVSLAAIQSGGTIVPSKVLRNKIGVTGDGIHGLGNNAYGLFLGTVYCSYGIDTSPVLTPTMDVQVQENDVGFNNDVGVWLSSVQNVTLDTNRVFSNRTDGVDLDGGGGNTLVTNAIHDNGGVGLSISSATGTRVDTNDIFANMNDGIDIDSGGNNTLVTNSIHGNQGDGVRMDSSNEKLSGNTITGNTNYGVEIIFGTNNEMTGNLVYGNATAITPVSFQKNISLDFYGGPLPNDAGDVDSTNPNHGQNYPVITPVTGVTHNLTLNQTTVNFTLDTVPGTYRVDLYSNMGPTAVPGGDNIVRTDSAFVVGSTPAPGSFTFSGVSLDNFSMLATTVPESGNGETSEFSPVVAFVGAPAVSITPSATMNFGDIAINADSPEMSVSVNSSGTATYHLTSIGDTTCSGGTICSTGAFTCQTTCTNNTDYAPGSACLVKATFHPPTLGAFSKTIQICDALAGSPRNITLTGNGVVPPPIVISPATWDFGSTLLGGRSATTSFTIFNPGTIPVTLGQLSTSPGFVLDSTDCGASIAATARCQANVFFVPTRSGLITGTLSVPATGDIPELTIKRGAKVTSGPVATAALSGTGTTEAILDLPSAIDFGDYTSGTPPIVRTVTLRNNGNAVLTLSNVSVTGPFALTNGCPFNMQPGESCTLSLSFSSAALAPYSGTLVVQSNAAGGSRSIPLSARTVDVAAPRIRVSPISIGFGDRLLGTVSASQRVTITNEGNANAVLAAPATTSLDFLVVGTTCGVTLAPAQTCFADVALRPVGFGPRSGQLLVTSNAAGSPSHVDLLGTGCRPFSSASSRLGASFGCSP